MIRHPYWSNTKFAGWLRKKVRPDVTALKEWEKASQIKKWLFWVAEDGLDYLQNVIYWPSDILQHIRWYVSNRWVYKTHALTSNLKRGKFHEFDARLLHALFDELVIFVEIEKAWDYVFWIEEEPKMHRRPWYCKFPGVRLPRIPEAGLSYLQWASKLKSDSGEPTHQAYAAQEMIILYKWWKEERPKRPHPGDTSGWTEYCANKNSLSCFFNSDELEKKKRSEISEICDKMEKEQEDEDTEILIRLIKIRYSLWT